MIISQNIDSYEKYIFIELFDFCERLNAEDGVVGVKMIFIFLKASLKSCCIIFLIFVFYFTICTKLDSRPQQWRRSLSVSLCFASSQKFL